MSIETGSSTRGSEGSAEPVVFRSETFEVRMPASALTVMGSDIEQDSKKYRPIVPVETPVVSKSPEAAKDPTERQLFWRNMYQTGELSPYKKNRGPVKFDALRDATYEAITDPIAAFQHAGDHIRAIDIDFRGGVDIGDGKVRLQRMAVMAGNMVPFFAFDVVTSIPSELVSKYFEKYVKDSSDLNQGLFKGTKKIIDVQNDKVVTALGDMLVTKLTGEKGAWIHEAGDKSADLLQTAADDYLEDAINGPVIESAMRLLFQLPIAGALIEQGWTRLSLLQERSQLNKGIAKSFYMGIGLFIGVWRGMEHKDKKRYSPSAQIVNKIWEIKFPNEGKAV